MSAIGNLSTIWENPKKKFIDNQRKLSNLLLKLIGLKDSRTQDHSLKVAEYGALIAKEMGFSPTVVEIVTLAGLVHDLGKIAVPDNILNKPSALTKKEFVIIKDHPTVGAEIISMLPEFSCLIPAIKYHHERFDGKGYPETLKGEEIPLIARIITVADAFDAMTNDRSYRSKLTLEDALNELEFNAGTQFDPHIVQIFKRALLKNAPQID